MKALTVFWRIAHAYLFYPAMVGLFLWLYFKKAHWGFGLLVIIAILVLDPIWRTLARSAMKKRSK